MFPYFTNDSLYHMKELGHAGMAPLRMMANATKTLFSHPMHPLSYTEFGKHLSAAGELLERVTQSYCKPEFGLKTTKINGKEVAVNEEIILEKPFCNLRHFKRATNRKDAKLLVVAPMSGHHATLLRGTVEALLPHHDVYITDWQDARVVPMDAGKFDLDDYIDYLIEFLCHLGPNTHTLAVCQPSVPLFAAVALLNEKNHPCAPKTMTLMGGPVDTRKAPTQVNQFAQEHSIEWFEQHVVTRVPANYPGFMRRVYPGFLQLSGFMSMNLERHVGEHVKLFNHLVEGDGDGAESHRKFYDEYLAVADLPADYYLQTVQAVFHDHSLPDGNFLHYDQRVNPGSINKTAILAIEGGLDDISGVGQTKAALEISTGLAKNMKKYHLQKNVGHYGIFNGRKYRESIRPVITSWVEKHR
jgi:poly(3-hydroxybutyrate) depolymerase